MPRFFFSIFVFLIFISNSSLLELHAEEVSDFDGLWSIKRDIDLPDLKVNSFRYANRATCALDSKKPIQTALLLIDSMNAAKISYRLAKAKGVDVRSFTENGALVFRYGVNELISLISKKVLKGELPLLPADTREGNGERISKTYKDLMLSCKSDDYCEELDLFLSKLWKQSEGQEIDHRFNHGLKFLNPKNLFLPKSKGNLSCHYLKKFSSLDSNLFTPIPNKATIEAVIGAGLKRDNFLAECSDFSEQENINYGVFQYDIRWLKDKVWNKKGFDFWHSLKLYTSWAWRNAPVMEELLYPYANAFKSLHLENSVLFFPKGCKTMVKPECNNEYLSNQYLRNFTGVHFAMKNDFLNYVPEGPQDDLIKEPLVPVNADILSMIESDSAAEWLKDFKSNFTRIRGIIKGRLSRSVNQINLITNNISWHNLALEIENIAKEEFIEIAGPKLNEEEMNKFWKSQMYYLCGEFNLGHNKNFSIIRKNLQTLKNLKIADSITKNLVHQSVSKLYDYYWNLAEKVLPICKELERKNIWEKSEINKGGFSPWFQQEVYNSIKRPKKEDIPTEVVGNPLLSFQKFEEDPTPKNVICYNAADCARKVLQSMVGLHSVMTYAHTFWTAKQGLSSPALLNPMAERTVCKVYDPWFQTKQAFFQLMLDVVNSIVLGWAPTPLYLDARLRPGRVVSFKKLIEEGSIKYDPVMDKDKIDWRIIADFGPLIGVPCAISYGDMPANGGLSRYAFGGISVTSCRESTRTPIEVTEGGEFDLSNGTSRRNFCAGCTLDFSSLSNLGIAAGGGALGGINPLRPMFYLFRGSMRFASLIRNKVDIPRSFSINPNHVMDTYRRFGKIPKHCVKNLLKGHPCLRKTTGARILNALSGRRFRSSEEKISIAVKAMLPGGYIKGMSFNGRKEVYVELSNCRQSVLLKKNRKSPYGWDITNPHVCRTNRSDLDL